MQFLIRDVEQDILCLTVYDRDFFAPDGTTKHEKPVFRPKFRNFGFLCISKRAKMTEKGTC
jgi:hypothetical protein